MSKPKLLDLFCGAGGAARGYQLAGFCVTGVDVRPQPRYAGDHFCQADVMEVGLPALLRELGPFDAVHSSPPCQAYAKLSRGDHPRLIEPVREQLLAAGLPYVLENIEDAKPALRQPIRLCGSMFALRVQRHRLFEMTVPLLDLLPPCAHGVNGRIRAYYGKPGWLAWQPRGANVQAGWPPAAAARFGGASSRRHGHRLDDLGRAQGSDPPRLHGLDRRPAHASSGERGVNWLLHPRWWLYELGLRRQALRHRAWRCVLLGHRSEHFSAFCVRCGDLVL